MKAAILIIVVLSFTTVFFALKSMASADAFTQQECYQMSKGDINHDGKVAINDLSILLSNYGRKF